MSVMLLVSHLLVGSTFPAELCILQVYPFGPHYVFSIASLESFEQKMAAAQTELGIQSQDFIPIRYKAANELL